MVTQAKTEVSYVCSFADLHRIIFMKLSVPNDSGALLKHETKGFVRPLTEAE